jgi:hypothetical protein
MRVENPPICERITRAGEQGEQGTTTMELTTYSDPGEPGPFTITSETMADWIAGYVPPMSYAEAETLELELAWLQANVLGRAVTSADIHAATNAVRGGWRA